MILSYVCLSDRLPTLYKGLCRHDVGGHHLAEATLEGLF